MTSARTLGAIFALSLLLSGCFDQSSKPQAWNVEPDGTESTFGVPAQIQQKVEIANVFARVTLDGVGQGDMELDGDVGRIRLSDIAPGNHTIVVHFYYNDGGTLVSLAEASKAVEIIAGQTATLTILETDYVFTDSDNDGISNADEIDQGTNYNDINDPVDQNSSSVGASSSEDVSSSSEQSISSDDSVSSVENSSIGVSSSDVGSDSSVESSNSSIAGSSSSTPIITPSSVSVSSSSSESVDSSSSDQSSSSSNGNNPQNIFTIDAGDDVVVSEGDLVELKVEVANTTGVATYRWTADFSGLDLQGATTDTLSFQTGNYTQNQTITFEVSVTSGGETLLDEVVVQINAENEPPVVTFENTQLIVAPDAAVALAPFSVTDPEGEPLTFTWEEALANPVMVGLVVDGSSASFTAPALSSADETLVLTFTFTAFDGERSAMQTVTVTVQDDNDTPVARITTVDDVLTVAENASLVLSGLTSTDLYTAAENLTYQWALESNFVYDLGITDWNSPALTINAPNLADDAVLQFSLVVTDDSTPALSSIKTFIDITIDAENNPAVLTLGRSAGSAEPGEQGITLTATATDPDLDQASLTYTFEWQNPAGFDVLNATTGEQVTFDAPSDLLEDTNLEFTVNATQVGTGALPIVSDSISVLIGGFAPPTAVAALANAMVTPSEAAAFNVTAAGSLNGTNPISSYSWSTSCDGNLANAAAAVATFTPKNRAANDVCSFTLEVSDGSAEGTVSDTLDVTIVATDEPPVLAPLATINTTANQPVSLDASAANDPENTALTFSWSTTSGVVLTGANTATASFTAPDSDEPQTLTFTVTVADGNPDNNLERNVTVEVAGNNAAPTAVITSLPGDSVGENTPVTLSGETSNDSHTASTALEYQWEQLSPTVAALDLGITDWQSASLSFTSPDLAADQVVTFGLTVTDSQGEPSTQDTYALTLEGVNNAPTVEVTASQNAVAAGATVTLTATAFNSDSDQQAIGYTYSWTAPAGFESLLAGLSAAELSSSEIVVTMPTDLSADVTPLIFTVTATEDITDGLTSEPAQTTITVGQGYVPPVAGIALVGGGSTITEGVAATFSAASSQLGTDVPVTYNWSTDCPGAFDSTSGVQVSFTGDNLTASISCEVIVSIDDNSGNAAVPVNARLPVTLSANNDAPVTTGPAAPIDAIARMPVALEGFTVSDVDTDEAELTYEWTADVAGAEAWLSDTAALTPTLLAPPSPEDVPVIYTLRALDGGEAERTAAENATAVASVTVNIANNNDNPRAAIRLVMPASVTDIAENLAVNLVAEPVAGATRFDNFSDANELTFTWTPNAALQALGVMPASATGLDTYSFSLPNLEQPLADMNVSLVVRDPHGGISSTYDFPFAIKAENDAPDVTVMVSPQTASENQTVTFTATAEDPEKIRTLSYSWQQVDVDGNPVVAGFEPQVSCTTPATAACSFSAPFVQDDTPIYMAVTVSEEGAEPFLKQATSIASATVASGYLAWVLELQASAAPREGQPVTISINTRTEGTSQITNYDWTASNCLDVDFSTQVGADAETLNIALPRGQKVDYACDISLVVTDEANQTADAELNLIVEANDDVPVAVITDRPLTISGSNPDDPSDESLDGSASFDDESDTLVYVWEQSPTDTVQVNWLSRGEDNGVAFFSVPEQVEATPLNFTLTVCDAPNDPARCDATPETITLTVSSTNHPPVAQVDVTDATYDAANDRYIAKETEHSSQREAGEGEVVVTLSGEGSSDPAPSNGQLNYAWMIKLDSSEAPLDLQGAADLTEWAQTHLQIAPADWASSSLQFTTPNLLTSRTFVFDLVVSDSQLSSIPEQVRIYIEADNDEPVVTATSNVGTAEKGNPINLSATASEPDYEQKGDAFNFSWTATAEEIDFAGNENLASLQVLAPELASEQTVTFTASVRNSNETNGPVGSDFVAVGIRQGYFPPEITALTSDISVFTEDDVVTLTATIENNTSQLSSITWQATACVDAVITPFNSMDVDVANGNEDARSARVELPNRAENSYSCEITVEVVDSNDPAGSDSRVITLSNIVAGDDDPEISNVTAVLLSGNPDDTFVTGELVADIRDPEQLLEGFEWTQIPAEGDAVISVPVNWVNGSNTGTAADLNAGRTTARFTLGSAQPVDVKLQFAITATDGSNETTVNTQLLTLDNTNTAPYAGENSSQTVNESEFNASGEIVPEVVTLAPVDASSPLDDFTANGDLEFTWIPNPSAQAVLNIAELDLTQSTLSFTVPNLETGTGADQDVADLSFTLIVNDGQLNAQSIHTVSITANPDQPIITAITDTVTVDAGQPASLSVAAVDPEGKTLNYQWREVGSAGTADNRFTNTTSAQTTFTPETDAPADVTYNLEVLVWETGNSIDQAVVAGPVTVVANTLYSPPVIALTQQTQAPEENMPVIFQAVVSLDERATNPTFTWAASCLGEEVAVTEDSRATNAAGDVVIEASFQAPNNQRLPFTCDISLAVDDQVSEPVVQSETGISVDANDDVPSVTVPVGLVVPSGMVGMPYSLDALALVDENGEQIVADPDTPLDELTYRWRVENEYAGDVIVTTEGSVMNVQWPTNRFEVNSLVSFYLDVEYEGEFIELPAGQSIDINVTAVNTPPVAVISEGGTQLATSLTPGVIGDTTLLETEWGEEQRTLTLSAAGSSDDFANTLEYQWTLELEESQLATFGLTVADLIGETITFKAPNLADGFSFDVMLRAVNPDNRSETSDPAIVSVSFVANNDPAQIVSVPSFASPLAIGASETLEVVAEDPEGQQLVFTWGRDMNFADGLAYLDDVNAAAPTFTAPAKVNALTYGYVVSIDDENRIVNTQTIEVPVAAGYALPVSDFTGWPTTIPEEGAVTLNFSFAYTESSYEFISQPFQVTGSVNSCTPSINLTGFPPSTVSVNEAERRFTVSTQLILTGTFLEDTNCSFNFAFDDGVTGEQIFTSPSLLITANDDLPPKPVIDSSVNNQIVIDEEITLQLVNPPLTDIEGQTIVRAWGQLDQNDVIQPICGIGSECTLSFPNAGEYTVFALATTNDGADIESDEVVKSEPFIINVSLKTPSAPPTILDGNGQPFTDMTVFQVWAPIPYDITETSGSGNVTVTSSNSAVAEVVPGADGQGEILIKGIIDDATITFTEEEGDGFEAISVSYTINVAANQFAIVNADGDVVPEVNFQLAQGGSGKTKTLFLVGATQTIATDSTPFFGNANTTANVENISAENKVEITVNSGGTFGSDIHRFYPFGSSSDVVATLRVNVVELAIGDVVIPQPEIATVAETEFSVGEFVELNLVSTVERDSGGLPITYSWRLLDQNGQIINQTIPLSASSFECSNGLPSGSLCALFEPTASGVYNVVAVAYRSGEPSSLVQSTNSVELTFTAAAAPPTVLNANGESFNDMTVSQVAFPIPFEIADTSGSGLEVVVESTDETVAIISRTGPTLGEIVIVGTGDTAIRFTEPAGNGFEAAVFEFNLTVAANTLTITNESGEIVDTLDFEVVSGGLKTQTIFIEEFRIGGAIWTDPEDRVGDNVSGKSGGNFEWQISTNGTFGSDIHRFRKLGSGGTFDGEAYLRVNVTEMDLADVVIPKPQIMEMSTTEFALGERITLDVVDPPWRDNGGRELFRGWRLINSAGELLGISEVPELLSASPLCSDARRSDCVIIPRQAGEYRIAASVWAEGTPVNELILSDPITITFSSPIEFLDQNGAPISEIDILMGTDAVFLEVNADPAITGIEFLSDSPEVATLDGNGRVILGGSAGETVITATGDINGVTVSQSITIKVAAYKGETSNVAKLAFNQKPTVVNHSIAWDAIDTGGVYTEMCAIGDKVFFLDAKDSTDNSFVRSVNVGSFGGASSVSSGEVVQKFATGIFTNGKIAVVPTTYFLSPTADHGQGFQLDILDVLQNGDMAFKETFVLETNSINPVGRIAFLGDAFFYPVAGGDSILVEPTAADGYVGMPVAVRADNAYSFGNLLYAQEPGGTISQWQYSSGGLVKLKTFVTAARLVGVLGNWAYVADKENQSLRVIDFNPVSPTDVYQLPILSTFDLIDPRVSSSVIGGKLYLADFGRVSVYDLSVPRRPYVQARFDVLRDQSPVEFMDLAVAESNIVVSSGASVANFYAFDMGSLDLRATSASESSAGGNREYTVTWDAKSNTIADVKCLVTGGFCEVVDINLPARSARVIWALPEEGEQIDNHHEIIVVAASENYLLSKAERIALTPAVVLGNGISLPVSAVVKNISDKSFAIVADGGSGQGLVTYRSDNLKVAKVNVVSGEVQITGRGQAKISAVGASGARASYQLTVKSYLGPKFFPDESLFGESVDSSGIAPESDMGPLNVIGHGLTAYEYIDDEFFPVNVADPTFPGRLVGNPLPEGTNSAALQSDNIFFLSQDGLNFPEISIFDIQAKANPQKVKQLSVGWDEDFGSSRGTQDVRVSANYLAWSSATHEISFIERSSMGEVLLSKPYTIRESPVDNTYHFYDFEIEGDILYTGGNGFGGTPSSIRAYDIANPRSPMWVGDYSDTDAITTGFGSDVKYVRNGYVAFYSILNGANAFEVIDYRSLASPVTAFSSRNYSFEPDTSAGAPVDENSVMYLRNYVNVAGEERFRATQLFDLSDPYAPKLLGSYPNIGLILESASEGLIYGNGNIYDVGAKVYLDEEVPGSAYNTTKTYFVQWDQGSEPEDDVLCRVTAGTCDFVDKDLSNNIAEVEWTFPRAAFGDTVGEHEMYIFVGNENYFISNSVRVDLIP